MVGSMDGSINDISRRLFLGSGAKTKNIDNDRRDPRSFREARTLQRSPIQSSVSLVGLLIGFDTRRIPPVNCLAH
jgi:hypothetical protein